MIQTKLLSLIIRKQDRDVRAYHYKFLWQQALIWKGPMAELDDPYLFMTLQLLANRLLKKNGRTIEMH